jgi:hypothetical protein
MQQIS